jgi:muramidase (phage lysozyme)
VDTYVKPAQSPLRGLADALGTMDKGLSQLIETRDRKAEQDDELRGKAAFYNDSAGELAKAVSDGQIPATASPFYLRGFKNAQGAAAGENIRAKWQDAWDNWDGKDSEDPKAFDTFFHEFVSQHVGTEDPDVLRGVLPSIEALQANATTQYTQYRHDQTVQGSLTAHGAVISGAVQDGVDAGLVSDRGADYPAIFGSVDKVVAESLAKGDPGGKAVNTFIDVMSGKMLETKDPGLLKWFDQKVPGQDYTYGETPHGLEVKNATVNALESMARQQAAGLTAAEKQDMERKKDEAQTGIINGILANRDAPFDEKLLTQAEKNGDPLIRLHAKQWKDDLTKGQSDQRDLNAFYDDVVSGRVPPKQALLDALSHGVFGTAEDMRAATSFVQSFQTSEDTITKTLDGRVVSSLLSTIKDRTAAGEDLINPISGMTDDALAASADLRQLVTRWIINNPKATQPEIDEQSVKFGKQILDRLSSADIGGSAKYGRDPNLPFENPYAEPAKPGEPSDGETPSGQQKVSNDPKVRAWEKANNITPENRRKIEDQAAKAGMEYDEFILERAIKNQDAKDPAAAKKISYDPNDTDLGEGDRSGGPGLSTEQASDYIDRAFAQATQAGLSDDERTNSLLDLIGQGESGGNYNAVYGNAQNTRDLGGYTLDEILGHQQYARRNGMESTAIGKYQFLYKTLKGLKAEMGLSGSEKFTPQLQDQLGRALLNRRGLQAYRSGRISKGTFALSLSKEWASLPNPRTGQSYYSGDGLNKSRVPRSAVYDALGFTPASYSPGDTNALKFDHADQEAGVKSELKGIVSSAFQELGLDGAEVISGYRSPDHPAERGKKSGGGEHTHGNAMDVSMKGLSDDQRSMLVQKLISKGAKRFITYGRYPDMLHVDLKDQTGNGQPYFMHNKSAKNLKSAPAWIRALAQGNTV